MISLIDSVLCWKRTACLFGLLVLILAALFSDLAMAYPPLHSSIRTINVITGAPQPSDDGKAERNGGFGDVAANVLGALEIKRRYPKAQVRLVVTSARKRYEPIVPTTDEIIKIMMPETDPSRKSVTQYYRDIEVVFVDFDFARLLNEDRFAMLPGILEDIMIGIEWKRVLRELREKMPHSDLNVAFSVFPESGQIVQVNTRLAIGTQEIYADNGILAGVIPRNQHGDGPYLELITGPHGVGFLMTQQNDAETNWRLILDWLAEKNIDVGQDGPFAYGFGYSAAQESVQTYVHAMANLPRTEPLIVFGKGFPTLDLSILPEHVKFIPLNGIPHDVMSALIANATISPLVTGDISSGQAMSSLRPDKTYVYEAPWWKGDLAEEMIRILAKRTGYDKSVIKDVFLFVEHMENMNAEEIADLGRRLAPRLADAEFQRRYYEAISELLPSRDTIGNAFVVANAAFEQMGAGIPVEQDSFRKTLNQILQRESATDNCSDTVLKPAIGQ